MNKKLWSPEDDALIVELVKKFGCGKWTYISKMLKENYSTKRSEKQIRERYPIIYSDGTIILTRK